jgi:ATP phosphoribosyltransferase
VNTNAPRLRIGIPKGSLQDTTQKLFVRAGYDLRISGRSYYPGIDDPEIECILIRPQEMSRYVGQGILDCAITGLDWILENDFDVAELADLRAPWPNYGPVRWVMASKTDSPFQKVEDLEGRRIATEAVGMTRRFLARHGVEAKVEFSWGATEVKPPILADAIVDVSETGASLRAPPPHDFFGHDFATMSHERSVRDETKGSGSRTRSVVGEGEARSGAEAFARRGSGCALARGQADGGQALGVARCVPRVGRSGPEGPRDRREERRGRAAQGDPWRDDHALRVAG